MSSLVEVYSLGCGAPIGTPTMVESYFPLETPLEKAVLIHAFAGAVKDSNGKKNPSFPSKIYDYYQEVISLLKPVLEPLGYKFYQIGAAGEAQLSGVKSLCGQTTMHQCNYLVRRAAILLGNDSMWAHVRGHSRMPLVVPYGSTSKPHFPFWKDDSKTILIESHRLGKKPSYSSDEDPKTINWITPEKIASSCLTVLGVEKEISRNSVYIGPDYLNQLIELVPDVIIHPDMKIKAPIVVRMDYHHDEDMLFKNLMLRKASVITSKEVDIKKLKYFKDQIYSIRVEVDKVSPEWVKSLKAIGIKTDFFSTETDPYKLKMMRLDFYDACLFESFIPPNKGEFLKYASEYLNKKLDDSFSMSKLMFKSNKILLSNGKIFLSKPHWQNGIAIDSSENNVGEVIDDPAFWEEYSHYYFFTE